MSEPLWSDLFGSTGGPPPLGPGEDPRFRNPKSTLLFAVVRTTRGTIIGTALSFSALSGLSPNALNDLWLIFS